MLTLLLTWPRHDSKQQTEDNGGSAMSLDYIHRHSLVRSHGAKPEDLETRNLHIRPARLQELQQEHQNKSPLPASHFLSLLLFLLLGNK